MKKYCLIIIVVSLILGINESSYSQGGGVLTPNHDPYDRNHNVHRTPLYYSPLREADVFWQKRIWRVIDFREKINQPFYYPTKPVNGRKSFMTVVFDGIKSGTIIAYTFDPYDDQFYQQLSAEEIVVQLAGDTSYTDMVSIFTGNDTTIMITTPTYAEDIFKIQIKEEWYFDKQRGVMDVRIIGLLPYTRTKDEEGALIAGTNKPLFWIYFPQARSVFANAPVYNRGNDAKRITYDDLFAKRMFGSYITKEQNVYDRAIIEYTRGLDALLEAERIKEEIFIKEHDLWEF